MNEKRDFVLNFEFNFLNDWQRNDGCFGVLGWALFFENDSFHFGFALVGFGFEAVISWGEVIE